MANEITPAGYDDLRKHIAERWESFQVRYEGAERLSLSVHGPRVTPDLQGKNIVFTIRLALTDADVAALPEPRTFDEIALIALGGSEDSTTEMFAPATLSDAEPELVITYRIRLPTEGLPGSPGKDGHSVNLFEQHQDPGASAAPGDFWIEIP